MKKYKLVALTTLLMLLCAFTIRTNAQDVKALQKANAKTIKKLKKEKELSRVEIKIVESGNYWYYLLVRKQSRNLYFGVADSNGNVIIKPVYSKIEYIPSLQEGYSNVPTFEYDYKKVTIDGKIPKRYIADLKLYHKQSDGHFLCNTNSNIFLYDLSGKELFQCVSDNCRYIPGYLIIGTKDISGDSYLATAYVTKNYSGEERVIKYLRFDGKAMITTSGKILLDKPWSFGEIDENNVLKYKRLIDGVLKEGALKLDNDTLQIPCLFNDIMFYKGNGQTYSSYKDGYWKVRRNSNDEYEEYVFGKNYAVNYRDKGEEYYDKGMYQSVISYYANEGIDAPWAKFFTAMALMNEGSSIIFNAKNLCESIEKNDALQSLYKDKNLDFDLAEKYFTTANQAFDAYLEQDSIYAQKAQIERGLTDKYIKDIPELKDRLKKAYALLEQRKAEEELAALERARREQEANAAQQNAFVNILASAFANALVNSVTKSTSSSQKSSYKSSSTGVKSSTRNSSPSSYTKTRRTCKLCNGTGRKLKLVYTPNSTKYCDECKKTVPKGHSHVTCDLCNGKGYEEY